MKYFVLLCNGAADRKISALGDKTPLEAAEKPTFNMLSYRSFNGLVSNVSKKFPSDAFTSYLSVVNCDPDELTGFASFDATAAGISLDGDDTAYRCSFVTLTDNGEAYAEKQLTDCCAPAAKDEITKLISALNKGLSTKIKKFYANEDKGILVWKRAPEGAELHSPEEALDKRIGELLPAGEGSAKLLQLFEKSFEILNDHPVNVKRRERGEKPLNSIWLWSASKKPGLTVYNDKWKVSASVISDDRDVKIISGLNGMKYIDAAGVDSAEKAQTAIKEFENGTDLVLYHTNDAAERALAGDADGKVKVIEDLDANVLAPVYEYLCGCGDQFKLLVTTGISALTEEKAFSADAVPFFMYNSMRTEVGYKPFSETNAKKSGFYLPQGYKFTSFMIRIPEPAKEETQQENGQQ
ncbi:MAG: hypothetical protein IJT49_01245 [Clostridia bacterium]|nr:hypothetical protein [Clostridia bacterium]